MHNQGLPVISRVKVLNRDSAEGLADWELSVSYYDTKGRVILSRFQNATKSSTTQGTGYNSIRYDFMDRPLITRSSNTNTAANKTAEEYYKYEYYTGSSRLYRSWHRAKTTDIWQVMQKLSYDDLGRISREVLGAGGEVRDYKYNLRGQLESINGTYANTGNKEGQPRTFGEVLEYEHTGNPVKRYDSKISSMIWRGQGATRCATITSTTWPAGCYRPILTNTSAGPGPTASSTIP
ncbi:hypothetical protein KRR40_39155 [Niabella defluvii]|nr:hypothetical protein KRR40_39155 [Niabella sp. I65]